MQEVLAFYTAFCRGQDLDLAPPRPFREYIAWLQRQDLARAREIGGNSVRVLVPYKPVSGWTDNATGEVNPTFLNELQRPERPISI